MSTFRTQLRHIQYCLFIGIKNIY